MAGAPLRLFVAVRLPDVIRGQIGSLQRQIRDARLFHGSFGKTENLHVTLKFLGNVEAEAVEEVKRRLASISFEPFTLQLGELGTFGGKRPRVLWLGLEGSGLVALHNRVEEVLVGLVEPDSKRFHPHVTVARIKSGPRAKQLTEGLAGLERPKGSLDVEEFALFQSVLHSDGAQHRVLEIVKAESQP